MNTNRNKTVRTVYGCLLAVLTVVVGVMLIVECATVYYDGAALGMDRGMFSREVAALHLGRLTVPLVVWVVAIVAGYVLALCFPYAEKVVSAPSESDRVRILKRKLPRRGDSDPKLTAALDDFVLARFIMWTAVAGVGLFAAIVTAHYLFDLNNFPAGDSKAAIVAMLRAVLPYMIVAFAAAIVATVVDRFLLSGELKAMKNIFKAGRPVTQPAVVKSSALVRFLCSGAAVNVLRVCVLAVGVSFVIAGSLNGGAYDVLYKASNLCKECVGLG